MKKSIKTHGLPLLVLLFFFAAVYAPFLFKDASGAPYRVLHWDFASQYYPWLVYASDVIRSGSWPLWCPYVGAGDPFFINPQSQLYSPITLLVTLVHGYSQYVAQVQSIAMLAFAGIGAYFLSHTLWRSRWGALMSGFAFGASAALYGNLQHSTYISSYAWMPWLFLMIHHLIDSQRPGAQVGLTLIVYMLVVSGYPAIVGMCLLWGFAWTLFLLWEKGEPFMSGVRTVAKFAPVGLFSLGMSCVYWLPVLAYRHQFTRGQALSLDEALNGGNLSFKNLWGLVFHFLTAQPLPGMNTDISMRGLYLGALSLPFIGVAILCRRDARTAALGVFSLGAFLMACGGQFFGRVALHLVFPVLNFSRFPAGDSRALMALGLVLLAGRGFAVVIEGEEASRRVLKRGLMALVALLGAGMVAFSILLSREAYFDGPFSYLSLEILLVLLAFPLIDKLDKRFSRFAVLALLAVDLGTGFLANIVVAGEPPGNYAVVLGEHNTAFPVEASVVPRQLGTRGSLLIPGDCEPANVGFLTKTFYVGDYNPLRLLALDNLISSGLTGWLQSGPRLVVTPSGSAARPSEEFLKHAYDTPFVVKAYRPNQVRYHVTLAKPGLVVFNEVYFPGWRARWKGHDVPMIGAYGGLRGLELPPGTFDLLTYFDPPFFKQALAVSLGALVLFVIWSISVLRRQRATSNPALLQSLGSP